MDAQVRAKSNLHRVDWRIGTIGFSYDDWVGPFYPPGKKPADFLPFYARHYDSVELDTTFYAIPPVERVRRWADNTPDHFRFCVKTPKEITHETPLAAATGPMTRFVDACRPFGHKLGVVLIQFAPSFEANQMAGLDRFLNELPTDVRFAVELRHRSWSQAETLHMLHRHRCAMVAAEYVTRPRRVFATTDFLYLRWIGQHGRYAVHDREQVDVTPQLEWWHQAIGAVLPQVHTVWGFFGDDYAGYSIGSANRLRRMAGLDVREPEPRAVTLSLFD
jgi:uncharacterized protein YecE (DUF72 family)